MLLDVIGLIDACIMTSYHIHVIHTCTQSRRANITMGVDEYVTL